MRLPKIFKSRKQNKSKFQMVTVGQNGFYSYDGVLYRSELVRATIRPEVTAIGKLLAKHIRESEKNGEKQIEVNPEVYMRFLLEEPNQYMTGQDMQEKMATQLALNGNAFAMITRDENGIPAGIYPVPCYGAEAVTKSGTLWLDFTLKYGDRMTVKYENVIHIRRDYGENYIFGTSPAPALVGLMELVTVMDQGLIKAIKNSGVIRWLLKFNTSLRPEDTRIRVKEFVENYLDYESDTFGAAGVDAKTDATRVEPKDYVPNASVQDRIYERILNFFNTNKKIVQSIANEEEWDAYFEQVIEPVAMKLGNEFTRKLFNRRQRGYGNKIFFESANLQHASITTKLNMREMVDRGALTPNEWREAFNLAPVPGGDKPLRRKDTGLATEGEGGEE